MGRVLKRVPLDFNWKIGQKWKGFLNPYRSHRCEACDGSGLNEETKKIQDEWYSLDNAVYSQNPFNPKTRYNTLAHSYNITEVEVEALVRYGRLSDLIGYPCYFDEEQGKWLTYDKKLAPSERKWHETTEPKFPTTAEVNEWNLRSVFGHDSINASICTKARAKDLGVYGHCEMCDGEGEIWFSDDIKKMSESWKRVEPPHGEGYQMWENTSEGSPMSPVFESLEELCEWCSLNASITGTNTYVSKDKWLEQLSYDL
jgi:hypothetical protein